jgi:hypothetical protein
MLNKDKKSVYFTNWFGYLVQVWLDLVCLYSQTCVQWPHLEPEKPGCYAEGFMKKDKW